MAFLSHSFSLFYPLSLLHVQILRTRAHKKEKEKRGVWGVPPHSQAFLAASSSCHHHPWYAKAGWARRQQGAYQVFSPPHHEGRGVLWLSVRRSSVTS